MQTGTVGQLPSPGGGLGPVAPSPTQQPAMCGRRCASRAPVHEGLTSAHCPTCSGSSSRKQGVQQAPWGLETMNPLPIQSHSEGNGFQHGM